MAVEWPLVTATVFHKVPSVLLVKHSNFVNQIFIQ